MRFSQLFGKTLRAEPNEAETISHSLMLKAGMLYPVASGVYSYMPLALRSIQKIETIIREEMNAAGSQEVMMPALQPRELWDETGRGEAFGQSIFTFKDRRARTMVLAPTHEEVITIMVRSHVQSYRDLPLILYQIQTKFRDEPRPRGGLIRVREFDMKDAYSFDADDAGLTKSYDQMVQAYKNIFQRCGLPAIMVEADSGAIGGKDSQEFILPSESGEDTVLLCEGCGYAANAEKAVFKKIPLSNDEPVALEEVPTPGCTTIEEVSSYLGVPKSKTLKAVFYTIDGNIVFVAIRGDLEVNEVKLKNALKAHDLRLASEEEVKAAGLVAGYASPIGLKEIRRVADDSIFTNINFVVGANRPGYHYKNANHPRDFQVDLIADIALVEKGFPCGKCGTSLGALRGIEVGHVFKLGTFFSEKLGAVFLDKEGKQRPVMMGCYGIGIGRLLAAALEQNHDEKGMQFPPAISPYDAYLCALNPDDPKVSEASEALYEHLKKSGVQVLLDDRPESAGVKFNDADLLGFPIRIVVSPRTLKEKAAEVKKRKERESALVPLDLVPTTVTGLLKSY